MIPTRTADLALEVRRDAAPPPDELSDWDDLVCGTPGTDVTQLSVWARVREHEGFHPEYVLVHRGGRLVGGVQVLLRSLPLFGRVGYVSYGPVLRAGEPGRDEVAAVLARELGRLPGVRMLFVQPPEGGEDARTALLRSGFRPSTAGIAPAGSVRLDLRRDLDAIKKGFPPRLRSWTRKWADAGVTVRRGGEDDVVLLARLMAAAADACGYSRPPGTDYLRHLYRELSATGNAALFVGEVHGVPVTADLVTTCGTTVRGRLGGFDRSGEGRRLSVPGAARWAIIQWAKAAGYEWLDFGGLGQQALADVLDRGIRSNPDWPGPDHTKLHYGGQAFRYPGAVERIGPAPVRLAYDTITDSEWGRTRLHQVKVALRSRSGGRARR
ncbi:lipid II:glycine glycyltransferase FemX [Blastococcus sp. SYSU D00820]